MKTKYGIVYDGCYSHLVAIKNEKEAEQHEVSHYYETLSEAKQVLRDYLNDEIANLQLCSKQVRGLKEEDF